MMVGELMVTVYFEKAFTALYMVAKLVHENAASDLAEKEKTLIEIFNINDYNEWCCEFSTRSPGLRCHWTSSGHTARQV